MPRPTSDATSSRTLSALASLPLFGQGAQTNNMAPTKTKNKTKTPQISLLLEGIDTIVFSVYGTLREDVSLCLEMAKEDAQAAPNGQALAPLPAFDGVTPLLQASGVKYYEWRALSADLTVLIAKPSGSKRPKAQIRVSSECLWRMGGGGLVAARLAEHYLRPLFEEDGYRVQLSRVDAAKDYQGRGLYLDDMRGVVKRPRAIDNTPQLDGALTWRMGKGGVLDSIAAGKSNALRLNFYDKTKEIKASGKEWFVALWESRPGYVPGGKVMRLEEQFGREMLHHWRIDTLDQLEENLPRMWAYAVKWFSFRTPVEGQSRPTRWPVADWWAVLSTWRGEYAEPLPKVKQVRPKFDRMCDGAFGYFTSMMALMCSDSPTEALSLMLQSVRSKKGDAGMTEALAAKQLRYNGFTMAD